MFSRVLVANRGEIAVRIIRALEELGIASVAVYSELDREAIHVARADEAYLLGGAAPAESYLNIDRIIAVARESGAEAIHPGYGFLAENAVFAARCEDEGIVFIGPPASAITAMPAPISFAAATSILLFLRLSGSVGGGCDAVSADAPRHAGRCR